MTSCALHLAAAPPASVLAATSGLTVVTAVPIAAVTSLAGAAESPSGIAGTIDTSRAWTISSTGEVRAIVNPLVAGIAWPAG
jgi:hypothetical protein